MLKVSEQFLSSFRSPELSQPIWSTFLLVRSPHEARELCGVVGGFMEPLCVVVYQNDPSVAQVLAVSLSQHFQIVQLVRTCKEVRPAVARHRAEALVLDLETSGPDEVDVLHREFPDLCIVGTHRLADDKLWAEAMSLGASDICEPRNDDVVRSLLRFVSHRLAHHAAA